MKSRSLTVVVASSALLVAVTGGCSASNADADAVPAAGSLSNDLSVECNGAHHVAPPPIVPNAPLDILDVALNGTHHLAAGATLNVSGNRLTIDVAEGSALATALATLPQGHLTTDDLEVALVTGLGGGAATDIGRWLDDAPNARKTITIRIVKSSGAHAGAYDFVDLTAPPASAVLSGAPVPGSVTSARLSAVSVNGLLSMQTLMNHLAGLSEMSTSVGSAVNSALDAIARARAGFGDKMTQLADASAPDATLPSTPAETVRAKVGTVDYRK